MAASARDGPRGTTGVFVNLTNHPVESWPPQQVEAARSLAAEIRELPFPDVGPEWSETEMDAVAAKVLRAVPPEATHALVMGEYALTFRIVAALQRRGITCLATRQRRDVTDLGDGQRQQRFAFLGFREYPRVADAAR